MQDIRNIAVIAHVDHGKTTLVDKMMLAGKLFRDGQDNSGEVLDSNDLERERGITILSKNVSINWKGTKINILDTPGHSDFGGEVERVLNMADGCLLLVDAFEGPMPQTRFVLQKALQLGLKPIVVVNKVDKPNCRPEEVYEMVFDLMCDLDATEEQLDFSVVYGSAKNGWMGEDYNHPTDNIDYLLDKMLEKNLALRVQPYEDSTDKWIVSGRGVLHLSVLIETMRREGYELQVGQPQVIYKEIDGVKCEPVEELTINVPEEFASKMIDMVTRRKGDMTSMLNMGERVDIEFDIPSRGIIGLRTNVLTASQGEAIMAHRFKEYQPYKGEISRRSNGSMIALETGTAFAYAIDKLQDRGKFFIDPGEEVYGGEVVGEHVHDNDLVVNVTKAKQLTNVRASGSDDKARVIPKTVMSLEECLEYIREDEYVEVTPKNMRMRKIELDHLKRKRSNKD